MGYNTACLGKGFETVNLGALYLDERRISTPQVPTFFGDIPHYDGKAKITIRDAAAGDQILWIKPYGMDQMFADRALLSNISWSQLCKFGLANGKTVHLNGMNFVCRLPNIGDRFIDLYGGRFDRLTPGEVTDNVVSSDWEWALEFAGTDDNEVWHWEDMFFWGINSDYDSRLRAVCGRYSAKHWETMSSTTKRKKIGFRPVLQLCEPEYMGPERDIVLEGQHLTQRITAIKKANSTTSRIRLFLQLPDEAQYKGLPYLSQFSAYTLLMNGKPVRQSGGKGVERCKTDATLSLTEQFYGKEYLIPWTVSQYGIWSAKDVLCGYDELFAWWS